MRETFCNFGGFPINRKLRITLIVLLLALAMLTGCGKTKTGEPAISTLAKNDMAYELADTSGIEVHDFELADGEVRTWNDRPVVAPLVFVKQKIHQR